MRISYKLMSSARLCCEHILRSLRVKNAGKNVEYFLSGKRFSSRPGCKNLGKVICFGRQHNNESQWHVAWLGEQQQCVLHGIIPLLNDSKNKALSKKWLTVQRNGLGIVLRIERRKVLFVTLKNYLSLLLKILNIFTMCVLDISFLCILQFI